MGRRHRALLIVACPALLTAASAPVGTRAEPVDVELRQAHSEAAAAESDMQRLEQAAARARDEATRLAAERQAAAAAITASEARISAADLAIRLAEARVADRAARLARRQAPLAALIAGIVTMGRRPPLLGSADSRSLDEFVRVRALLDTTLPVIRQRSAALSAELAESRQLKASAAQARHALAENRQELARRQQRFATLEARAIGQAARLGAGAVGASDQFVASAETEAKVRSQTELRRAGLQLAAELGALPAAPPRPGGTRRPKSPLGYQLPVAARVVQGLGAVNETGIRSRGLTLDSYAGQGVRAPADGSIAFAGAFQRHDGVIIIDHGGGWMTLMTAVRSDVRKGDRVRLGQPLGRALGKVNVELSTNGTPVSAAIIAGSSASLSIQGKSG